MFYVSADAYNVGGGVETQLYVKRQSTGPQSTAGIMLKLETLKSCEVACYPPPPPDSNSVGFSYQSLRCV